MRPMNDIPAASSGGGVKLLIVIVCYKVVELTIQCLHSIAQQIEDVPGTRVFVVENGSGPESVKRLRESIAANGWSSWVSLQAVVPNVGFTGGNNAALREAMKWPIMPKYFMLLNADTVLEPGALKLLVGAMDEAPHVGIMGSSLFDGDGRMQVSCFRDHSPLSELLRGASTALLNRLFGRENFPLAPAPDRPFYDWVSFAAAVIRGSVFHDIGLLDEGYFLYFDDADFCRVARQAGWRIASCPDARIVHLEGQSNEVPESTRQLRRRPRYFYVSRSRYFAKHYGSLGLWAANIGWSIGHLIEFVKRLAIKGDSSACEAEWRDIWTNAWAPVRRSNASLIPRESRIVI